MMTQMNEFCQTEVSSLPITAPKGNQLCSVHSIMLMYCCCSFQKEEKLEASPIENRSVLKERSFGLSALYQNEELPLAKGLSSIFL